MGKGATRSAEFRNLAGSPRPRDTAYYKGAAAATSSDWVPGSDRALSGTSEMMFSGFCEFVPQVLAHCNYNAGSDAGLQPKSESKEHQVGDLKTCSPLLRY